MLGAIHLANSTFYFTNTANRNDSKSYFFELMRITQIHFQYVEHYIYMTHLWNNTQKTYLIFKIIYHITLILLCICFSILAVYTVQNSYEQTIKKMHVYIYKKIIS